ncbi:hypothetical protein G7075_09850 [Phycicoccus sp. HDW14]|uniref:hypothetical protein n=1 Tax=Phycicoccus sp. HDW14 TaxID=2714941 RepID=UPI00140E8307|nr:hypothetical protein [Phycicoccus sp. HDW14]QIM21359.1 hypothetical protein G7075_09850 [Phycicoccus sp. HDW14]
MPHPTLTGPAVARVPGVAPAAMVPVSAEGHRAASTFAEGSARTVGEGRLATFAEWTGRTTSTAAGRTVGSTGRGSACAARAVLAISTATTAPPTAERDRIRTHDTELMRTATSSLGPVRRPARGSEAATEDS